MEQSIDIKRFYNHVPRERETQGPRILAGIDAVKGAIGGRN